MVGAFTILRAASSSAVLPVTAEILDAARALLDRYDRLPARDALHPAVATANGIREICSYDRDFDDLDQVQRIEP